MPAVTRFLAGRRVEPGEAREGRGGLLELPAADVDLAEKSERADVIRIEHRDVLERSERAVLIAALAQHARLLPEELLDLDRVVGDFEPARDQTEELVVVLARAHPSKELVEGDRSRRVARHAGLERELAGGLVAELQREKRGLLPERRRPVVGMAARPQLGRGADAQRRVPGALGAGAKALPRREIARPCGGGLLERRPRQVVLAGREQRPSGERHGVDGRVVAEDTVDLLERCRPAPRIAARRGELQVRQARPGRAACEERDGRLRVDPRGQERGAGQHGVASIAGERLGDGEPRRTLFARLAERRRGREPFDGRRQAAAGFDPPAGLERQRLGVQRFASQPDLLHGREELRARAALGDAARGAAHGGSVAGSARPDQPGDGAREPEGAVGARRPAR